MSNLPKWIAKIAEYHKSYSDQFLSERKMPRNEIEGIKFMMHYAFYQGRSDLLSDRFKENAFSFLNGYTFQNEKAVTDLNSKSDKYTLEKNYSRLIKNLHKRGLNKPADRLMVANIVGFNNHIVQRLGYSNVIRYLIDLIKSSQLKMAYMQLDNIWSIGPKISSFMLRDIVYVFKLEGYLNREDYMLLQPVDTWVHKVCKHINLIKSDSIYEGENVEIVTTCQKYDINPIHFNQGAWYVGTQSFKIVLDWLALLQFSSFTF